MILQPRDHALLTKVAKYSVLSTRQIATIAFDKIAHTTMMRRLRALEDENYIHRGVPLDSGVNTWILGSKGRSLLGERPSNVFMNRNTIEHDVHLTDVRLLFESMGLANDFTPEWEMKSQAMRIDRRNANDRVIPDGLMVESIKGESKVIAVELERTRKSSKRYERILQQYSQKASIDHIWYVASDLATVGAIFQAGRRVGFPMRKLWFTREDVLLSDKLQSRMWRANEAKATRLDEIGFDRLKRAQSHAQPVSKDTVEDTGPTIVANASKHQDETAVVSRLRAWPTTPDPSPPTNGGKGSGVVGQENTETTGSVEIKKCG